MSHTKKTCDFLLSDDLKSVTVRVGDNRTSVPFTAFALMASAIVTQAERETEERKKFAEVPASK